MQAGRDKAVPPDGRLSRSFKTLQDICLPVYFQLPKCPDSDFTSRIKTGDTESQLFPGGMPESAFL